MDDAAPTAEADEDINAMFLDAKKKKKKKKPKAAAEGEEGVDQQMAAETEKLTLNEAGGVSGDEGAVFVTIPEGGNLEDSWKDSDRDYTYLELLSRVFRIIAEKNPELSGERRKYTMVAPIVNREGSKKTNFANINDICKRMKREPTHLISYMYAELGTQGSVDGNQSLIIKGRFQQKQIESVLKHYIGEYVTCQTCKSADTTMKKENKLFFLQCAACGSSRAVSAIKSGYKAQIGKRKAMLK